jgi:salicylate hydroxylase
MFIAEPLRQQLERARDKRLRVLIVGAGVAGATLAQLLRSYGMRPVLIERASDHAETGYMIALVPLVDPTMHQLRVRRTYHEQSAAFRRYRLHGRRGQLLREDDIGALLSRYGEYRGLSRDALMRVLADKGAPVSYDTTLEAIRQTPESVHVTLRSGATSFDSDFDAVILADGLHSTSRRHLWRPEQISAYDTGWAGWVAWTDPDNAHSEQGDEIWGAGFFVGIYPIKDRSGIFLGGNRKDMKAGPQAFVERIRAQLRTPDPWIGHALDKIADANDPYFWNLVDVRAADWTVDRVALLGDAAAGFLPTAGIGAAMAMESATVLAQQLVAADRATVAEALQTYERVQRPRVEAAQDNSRQLARLVFRRSSILAAMRDAVARFVSLRTALRPIQRLLEEMPAQP